MVQFWELDLLQRRFISSAVHIELEFVVNALPVKLIGMNLTMMCNYIKFCANQLLRALGCSKHYNTSNPFEWMETISLQGKTNFFEKTSRRIFQIWNWSQQN